MDPKPARAAPPASAIKIAVRPPATAAAPKPPALTGFKPASVTARPAQPPPAAATTPPSAIAATTGKQTPAAEKQEQSAPSLTPAASSDAPRAKRAADEDPPTLPDAKRHCSDTSHAAVAEQMPTTSDMLKQLMQKPAPSPRSQIASKSPKARASDVSCDPFGMQQLVTTLSADKRNAWFHPPRGLSMIVGAVIRQLGANAGQTSAGVTIDISADVANMNNIMRMSIDQMTVIKAVLELIVVLPVIISTGMIPCNDARVHADVKEIAVAAVETMRSLDPAVRNCVMINTIAALASASVDVFEIMSEMRC